MAKESVTLQHEMDAEGAERLTERHSLQREVEALKLLNQEYLKQIAEKDAELAKWRLGQFAPPSGVQTDENISSPRPAQVKSQARTKSKPERAKFKKKPYKRNV